VRPACCPAPCCAHDHLKYNCKAVDWPCQRPTRFTAGYAGRRQAVMTVGNGEGNFFADEATLDRLEAEGRWCSAISTTPTARPRHRRHRQRGGQRAGPHAAPDRAFEPELGSATARSCSRARSPAPSDSSADLLRCSWPSSGRLSAQRAQPTRRNPSHINLTSSPFVRTPGVLRKEGL